MGQKKAQEGKAGSPKTSEEGPGREGRLTQDQQRMHSMCVCRCMCVMRVHVGRANCHLHMLYTRTHDVRACMHTHMRMRVRIMHICSVSCESTYVHTRMCTYVHTYVREQAEREFMDALAKREQKMWEKSRQKRTPAEASNAWLSTLFSPPLSRLLSPSSPPPLASAQRHPRLAIMGELTFHPSPSPSP